MRYTMPARYVTQRKVEHSPRILSNRVPTGIDCDRLAYELINPSKYRGIIYPARWIAYDEAGLKFRGGRKFPGSIVKNQDVGQRQSAPPHIVRYPQRATLDASVREINFGGRAQLMQILVLQAFEVEHIDPGAMDRNVDRLSSDPFGQFRLQRTHAEPRHHRSVPPIFELTYGIRVQDSIDIEEYRCSLAHCGTRL